MPRDLGIASIVWSWIFWVVIYEEIFFARSPIEYEYFLNRSYLTHKWDPLTDIITRDQSGRGSNSKKWVTLHSPDLQKWNLTIRCSLVSNLRLGGRRAGEFALLFFVVFCFVFAYSSLLLLFFLLFVFGNLSNFVITFHDETSEESIYIRFQISFIALFR